MTTETETVRCTLCRKQRPEADCFYFPKWQKWHCRDCIRKYLRRGRNSSFREYARLVVLMAVK